MTKKSLPDQNDPLNPLAYWQESYATWQDFGSRASKLWYEGVSRSMASLKTGEDKALEAETLTSEMMRAVSDLNLRQWHSMARLVEGFPAWMRSPQFVAGASLADWFDQVRRSDPRFKTSTSTSNEAKPKAKAAAKPGPKPKPAAAKKAKPAAQKAKPAKPKPKASKPKTPKLDPKVPVQLKMPKGAPDDLTQIKGIGPKLSEKLNDAGIYHFSQIASWNSDQANWIDERLAGKGRVMREAWVEQARLIGADGPTLH